jgi:HEAT repeat protein
LQKTPDDRSLPLFIQALTDEYSDVRRDAAIALGILKNKAALNPLHQALDDPDRDVCIFSQRAIQTIQEALQEPSNA